MVKHPSKKISQLVEKLFNECIAIRIRLINRVISNIFDRELEKHDITVAQVAIIGYLLSIQGGSPNDISRGLQIEKSTVSRNLGRLKEKGWISFGRLRNGRSKNVTVTKEGILTFEQMFPEWESALKKTQALLGRSNVELIDEISKSLT